MSSGTLAFCDESPCWPLLPSLFDEGSRAAFFVSSDTLAFCDESPCTPLLPGFCIDERLLGVFAGSAGVVVFFGRFSWVAAGFAAAGSGLGVDGGVTLGAIAAA